MKECGLYCAKCKNNEHLEKNCTANKNTHLAMDPSYILVKSSNGTVHAKFVGKNKNHAYVSNNDTSRNGTKKRSIWVPKALVTNIQGPKQVWVPKRN